ncbi:hypothetical protein F4777DRAFT_543532 [Nemania sp. FL0916]|nr:hypothetical protein F4777DRAFT_543532 [Nemania sp. FL0916]
MTATKSNEHGKPNIIRPFGNLECYEFHMLQLRFLGRVILNCRYSIPASLAAPEFHDHVVVGVEEAIARVVLEHPALRLDVVNPDTKRPLWRAVDEVDLAHHVQWEDVDVGGDDDGMAAYEETLHQRIEKLLDKPFTSLSLAGRPQWEVLILSNRKTDNAFLDIVFSYNHALGDGTSGKIFHQSLLRALNNTTPGALLLEPNPNPESDTETVPPPPSRNRILRIPPNTTHNLPPPIEKAGKFSISSKYAASMLWKELLRPPPFLRRNTAKAHWAPISTEPFKTRFRAFDIPAVALGRVLAACRAHGTTLTALLHALLLVAVAMRMGEGDATAFTGGTALDLRRHLQRGKKGQEKGKGKKGGKEKEKQLCKDPEFEDPSGLMGVYVSLMEHEFGADLVRRIRAAAAADHEDAIGSGGSGGDANGTEPALSPSPALVDLIWQCATQVRAEIQQRLDQGLENDPVGLMKFVPDWRAQFRADARSKVRTSSFIVTNLGVLLPDRVETEADRTVKTSDDDGGWTAAHALFAVSTEVCGAAFQVSPISVVDGALCVGCSWQDCVVECALAEAMVGDLRRWLGLISQA